jgi:hypothetical protein
MIPNAFGMLFDPWPANKRIRSWCRYNFNITDAPAIRTTIKIEDDGTVLVYAHGATMPLQVKPGTSISIDMQVHGKASAVGEYAVHLIEDEETAP